jgi:type II secretory pathway pseudopilin PulG
MEKKYTAFTLLEMLLVLGIIMILAGMSFTSFYGLQDTVKMNEYVLNIEQDIRSVQRAAMLLERNPLENWLYGLGIDFSELEQDGKYTTFKWCTPFLDYGDPTTRMKVPAFEPGDLSLDSTKLPITSFLDLEIGLCDASSTRYDLKLLSGYETSLTMPKATIQYHSNVRYVLFESVSGRAFFYDIDGNLLNYQYDTALSRLVIEDNPGDIQHLEVTISSIGPAKPRTIKINHLSGRIDTVLSP